MRYSSQGLGRRGWGRGGTGRRGGSRGGNRGGDGRGGSGGGSVPSEGEIAAARDYVDTLQDYENAFERIGPDRRLSEQMHSRVATLLGKLRDEIRRANGWIDYAEGLRRQQPPEWVGPPERRPPQNPRGGQRPRSPRDAPRIQRR